MASGPSIRFLVYFLFRLAVHYSLKVFSSVTGGEDRSPGGLLVQLKLLLLADIVAMYLPL